MGVASLTSFVKKHNLGTITSHPSPGNDEPGPIPAIVDGLAFAYHVGLVETFEGGGYSRIRHNVRRYIEYWRKCGLEPEFVWDGPFEREKLATVISRSTQSLERSITYMRLPDHLRTHHKYESAATRLPPLAHLCIWSELELLGVVNHCAEGEADSPTAELAQRKNGFVISNGEFPLVPPNQPVVELQFRVFQPAVIARAFSLPPTFLPILAALIGNDIANYSESLHTPRRASSIPFRGFVDPRELLRIAGLLSRCARMPVDTLAQVQDVVFAVLPLLLAGRAVPLDPLMGANLALSAHSYALRPLEAPSPTFPLHPRPGVDSPTQARARAAYHAAFKQSHLSSFHPHVLKHGVVMCQGSVEVPDFQSPMVRLARPLRRWVYAILRDAVGLLGDDVVEYVRRNDALHAATVPVVPLGALLADERGVDPATWAAHSPIALAPLAVRQSFFLVALGYPGAGPGAGAGADAAAWPARGTVAQQLLPLVVALRHLVALLPAAQAWSRHEVRCALVVGAWLALAPEAVPALLRSSAVRAASASGAAPRRDLIQHSVELVHTLVGVNLVAQALLLDHPPDGRVEDGVRSPHWVVDGRVTHVLWGMGEDEVKRVIEGGPADVRRAVEELEGRVWEGLEGAGDEVRGM
ncbi:uncharacterized protein RHOBADRAFT_54712 [Rhodotorula graminis WP1]|uniref:Uncharacterized protein n=1 Tax=Rhodotorula graminis (strain WP1) TaxID=578459 RepID=A0A0N8PZW9_RHOGW|nr:uncharacterized protein RHOBADRAFT_54712 [Rhodotorula graminis WP1]KPV73493.1 hypothetical protein RHOBADRAFT_54712 [Rhodotorula graminis WP1]